VDDDLDKNFRPGQVIRYVRTGAIYLLLNSREKANDDLTWFGGHSHYYDGYVLSKCLFTVIMIIMRFYRSRTSRRTSEKSD
jgi:hypothetical protein